MTSSIKPRTGRIKFRLTEEDNGLSDKPNKVGKRQITRITFDKADGPAKRPRLDDRGVSKAVITRPKVKINLDAKYETCKKEKALVDGTKEKLDQIDAAKKKVKLLDVSIKEIEQIDAKKNELIDVSKKELELRSDTIKILEELDIDIKSFAKKRKWDEEESEQNMKVSKIDVENELAIEENGVEIDQKLETENEVMVKEVEDMIDATETQEQTDDEILAEIADIDAFLAD